MIISVTKAENIKDYFIMLNFDNGTKGIVDLRETIFNDKRKIFEPLRSIEYLKKFTLGSWTLNWGNKLDLSPEYLYKLAMVKK
ncbi:DUF2442 domain-containing protein [Flavobacteriaceae bacterium]|nr:DUF2442 domain-containing protein [Flavobacteriaceae bacterium]